VSKGFSEILTCVCLKTVKVDNAVFVSRLIDKFDLRTRKQQVYCRGCLAGKNKTSDWLLGRLSLGELSVEPGRMER
jgi:hypothetical protein